MDRRSITEYSIDPKNSVQSIHPKSKNVDVDENVDDTQVPLSRRPSPLLDTVLLYIHHLARPLRHAVAYSKPLSKDQFEKLPLPLYGWSVSHLRTFPYNGKVFAW